MRSFNSTLEHLALTLTRVGFIDQACDAIALIFRSEIETMPFARTSLARFMGAPISDRDLAKLVRFMVRDMQRWASAIIDECGMHADDVAHDSLQTFKPEHAKLVSQAWDKEPTAPVWRAFDRAVRTMWPRTTAQPIPCGPCEQRASGIAAITDKCLHDDMTRCTAALAVRKAG